jgi:N-acetylmuramoyl-L-alanine amidase
MMELELNQALALEVERALGARGLEVRLIGLRGDYTVLYDRTRDAAGAQLFLSIHHDSVKAEFLPDAAFYSGFSLFISGLNPAPEKSLACASAIGRALRRAGFPPSGYHADPVFGSARPFADRENGVHFFDNLAVARTAAMPAVLIEAGVIVNAEEEQRLREPRVRRRIAEAIAAGAQNCLRKG